MDSVFQKIWQFTPHPFNCKKVGRVQHSSNFLILLSLIAIVIRLTCEIWTLFLKNIHQKRECYREGKQDFERLSNKTELSEEFIAIWREEQTLCNVMFPLYPDRNEKDKSLKRMSDKFQIFSDWYFRIRSISNARSIISLLRKMLKFQLCFQISIKTTLTGGHWTSLQLSIPCLVVV